MIFIGSSDVITFWMPFSAWETAGIASFAYGRSHLRASLFDSFLDEALESQSPSLVVVGLRPILDTKDTIEELSIRSVTDTWPYSSINRWKMIWQNKDSKIVLSDNSVDKGGNGEPESGILAMFPFWFDIMKYHDNYQRITKGSFFKINSENASRTKGYLFLTDKKPESRNETIPLITDTEKLSEDAEKAIISIINKANSKGFDLLFVLVPYCESEEIRKKYNEAKTLIERMGEKCVDFNEYFDEIGLDIKNDYYNTTHTNVLGAEKFTKFFVDYLNVNYDLPNHRLDDNYRQWNTDLSEWKQQEKNNIEICSGK